ncbi:hypothetical protein FRC06_001104 [Ceratobasidium sp. 370]|nr:hypothetical protein FRC06_001104 [Ceratobasidium sp. 370]
MAAPGIHPRHVLAPLAMTSKRLRSIAAPFIYEHVEIRNKEDRDIYARVGATKYVRRLTIFFDPYDLYNPRGALMDTKLCTVYPGSGISYHFPRCYEVRLVAQSMSEELPPAQRLDLVSILSQRVPPTISRVILETDLVDLSARFAVGLMMREDLVDFKPVIEIRTNRDEVVRSVEHAVYSHISRWTDPVPWQMHLVLRGPTHGTVIIWDESTRESGIAQRMWREKPMKPPGHPNRNKCRGKPGREDEDELLGVQEAMAEISRRNAGSGVITQAPLRRSSRQKGNKSSTPLPVPSGRLEVPVPKPKSTPRLAPTVRYPPIPSGGVSSSHFTSPTARLGHPNEAILEHMPLDRQTPAWHAGKLAAEIPSVVERMIEELAEEDLDRQGSCSCCRGLAHNVFGVQNPITRAELNVFVGTYYARRYAARCRMAKLARMRELQKKGKAKSDLDKQGKDIPERDGDVVQDAAGGLARKRRRRA